MTALRAPATADQQHSSRGSPSGEVPATTRPGVIDGRDHNNRNTVANIWSRRFAETVISAVGLQDPWAEGPSLDPRAQVLGHAVPSAGLHHPVPEVTAAERQLAPGPGPELQRAVTNSTSVAVP